MKLNLEIELDWIDEESTIDDVVKKEIIDGVMARVGEKIQKSVEQKTEATIDKLIVDKVNELTEGLFNDFINRPIQITDGYGDAIESYDKLEDLIKQRFDKFMVENVDKDGKIHQGYGKSSTRIAYIIDNQLKEYADKFTADAVKQVSEEIKTHVKDGLTTKLGKELMSVLKVNEMLQLEENNGRK